MCREAFTNSFSSTKFGFVGASVCTQSAAGPATSSLSLLSSPIHLCLFSLSGPGRWKCSGIKSPYLPYYLQASALGPLAVPASLLLLWLTWIMWDLCGATVLLNPFSSVIKDVSVLFFSVLTHRLKVHFVHCASDIYHPLTDEWLDISVDDLKPNMCTSRFFSTEKRRHNKFETRMRSALQRY